jgi:hypothetical protein
MNRIITATLTALAFACGAPSDEGSFTFEEIEGEYLIGNLGQEIFMPTNYGSENTSSSPQCSPPWGGGVCLVPNSKIQLYKLFASTCGDWWNARVVGAENYFQPFMDGLGDDWNYSGQIDGAYNISIRCEVSANGIGSFQPSSSGADNHATEFGTLMQWKSGAMRIDKVEVEALPGWFNRSESDRIRFAENLIKHEYGHSIGLGHGGTGIMRATIPDNEMYGATQTFGSVEVGMLQCYNEDSGGNDDC